MNTPSLLCTVLGRKEIENYALEPDVIVRAVQRRVAGRHGQISETAATALVEEIAELLMCGHGCREWRTI